MLPTESAKVDPALSRGLFCEIGFACFITVMGQSLRDVAAIFSWTGLPQLPVLTVPNIMFILSLLVAALFCLKRQNGGMGFASHCLSSVLLCLGFALMLLLETIDIIPLPIVVISGVLFGAGSAIGIMAWTSVFWIEGDRAMCEILAASLFACVIGLVLASNNGIVATLLTCVLLSVVSCACALYLFKDGYESGQVGCRGGLQDETVYQCVLRIARLVWKPGLCIGALGLISAISRSLVSSHSTSTMVTLTMLGEIISCFVLLIFFSKRSLTIDTVSMYKVLFPLGALSFLLLTFLGERYTVVLAVIAEFSFHMCSVLMIPQALVYSGSLRVSPHIVYGLLGCIVYPILYLGYPISILSDNLFGSTPYPALAAVGIFILSMASFIGVRSRNPEGAQPDNADICADMSVFEGAGISQRERQIIGLLLEGRDVPYISEMLCVSKNTVRTHVKSAYSKLGVHSKQELIDLCRESQKPL